MKNDKFYKIIKEIEKCRSRCKLNRKEILRLAYEKSPKEAVKIFTKIHSQDSKINSLAKKLTKLK